MLPAEESLLSFPIGPLSKGQKKWGRVVLRGAMAMHIIAKNLTGPLASPACKNYFFASSARSRWVQGKGLRSPSVPLSWAFLHFLHTIAPHPSRSPTPAFCGSCALFQHFPSALQNGNQLSVVGTALLWPGPHPRLADGAPQQHAGLLSAPRLRGWQLLLWEHHVGAHPTPSHPRRGRGQITAPALPVPRVPGSSRSPQGVSPTGAGSRQARLLRLGPAGFLSPGRTIKAPLLTRVAFSYVSTAFSLFTEYSDM